MVRLDDFISKLKVSWFDNRIVTQFFKKVALFPYFFFLQIPENKPGWKSNPANPGTDYKKSPLIPD
jgi:hypothetical protein